MQGVTLKKMPYISKLGYAAGNLGFGVVFQVVVSYLFLYATGVLKVSGSFVGIVVGFGVIWDGITDPVMGYISDNTYSKRFGRRHLYLLVGGIAASVFNYLLWVIDPGLPEDIKLWWILIAILLVKSSLTVYSTPHAALGAELSNDYDERSSIQGMRSVFFLVSLLLVLVVFMGVFFRATPEYAQGQLNPEAYPKMGLTASILIIISALVTYFTTRRYIPHLPKPQPRENVKAASLVSVFSEFKIAFKNLNYIYVVLGYMATNITTALFSVVGLHVYTYTFGYGNIIIGVLFGTQIMVSVLSQPLWVKISKRIDKKPSIIAGLILCIACCMVFLLLVLFAREEVSNNWLLLLPLTAILGLGSGVLFSMPMSMVADTIDTEQLTTGRRSEGVFYGLLTLCYKLSQSIVLFVVGFLLEVIGFNADLEVQSMTTVQGLGLILSIGCLVALLFGIFFYGSYKLSRNEVLRVQEQLRVVTPPEE